jgi:hypothetical protein
MCMKVPSTSLPQHTSRASLVSTEKKLRRILFEQASYVTLINNDTVCLWWC